MADDKPTARMTRAEIHGLGSWAVAVEALRALGPEWVPLLRATVLAKLREVTFAMELADYPSTLDEQFASLCRALKYLRPPTAPATPAP